MKNRPDVYVGVLHKETEQYGVKIGEVCIVPV